MPRSLKFDPQTRSSMAKMYLCGESPTEIAKQYGTSAAYVINVARDHERQEKIKRLQVLDERMQRRREYDRARRLAAPNLAPKDEEIRPLITLARVSIQRKASE